MVFFQAVADTGGTRTAFRLELAALAIYTSYCTVVVGIMKLDIAICWTAEHVYAIALLVLCYAYMRSGHWKTEKSENTWHENIEKAWKVPPEEAEPSTLFL